VRQNQSEQDLLKIRESDQARINGSAKAHAASILTTGLQGDF
jgi:hypothetical protein